jgi:hypothetical protein
MVPNEFTVSQTKVPRYSHRASTPRNELFCLAGEALSLVPFQLRERILEQLHPEDVYGISCNTIFELSATEEQRRFFTKIWEKAEAFTRQLVQQSDISLQDDPAEAGAAWRSKHDDALRSILFSTIPAHTRST